MCQLLVDSGESFQWVTCCAHMTDASKSACNQGKTH